ncbi:hypothetical protein SAMN05421839_11037 [Halolactibacillus halophilus]|uniref:Glycosyl hydrolase n=1 Tax=Halolactibacillus halophilus TaxID=306540 RepID=A0A1I5NNE2_9BACI|nr:glycoside hydrolase family 125 protein [Halolactibacillus halophilus]GEM01395.1 glycosyl hydrolase [Halolactibacillus halophilus]SFP23207.1 hypothetical protein SAMN05421839_11037 [Halolactibacillus halophilus]
MKQYPEIIQHVMDEVHIQLKNEPKLQQLFMNCFPNTLETTTKRLTDGTTFVFTGDIPAMWLRDSAEQVAHYLPFLTKSDELQELIKGLIKRHLFYINHDPYTNAFNEEANDQHWNKADKSVLTPWIWERKYEVDSVCFSLKLIYTYWKQTSDDTVIDATFLRALDKIISMWEIEQYHDKKSSYTFERDDCPDIDTLSNNGKGTPVNYTGMTWSGFRPSDDACEYHYHIPDNMFVVVVLGYALEMISHLEGEDILIKRMQQLQKDVQQGIENYGIVHHPEFGEIYAYETDGFGHHVLMDDAGTPSLLSAPYLGYCRVDDEIYQNTRKFVLSEGNPYYYEGIYAKGLGSPHTPEGYIWPIGLSMQVLTEQDPKKIKALIDTLASTDAGTNYMHEGFDANDPYQYTREWFAWSNSLFSQALLYALEKKVFE